MRPKLMRAVLPLALALLLGGCDVEVTEVDRVPSPDGKVDLVISTADAGATTSVGYHVNLVAPGSDANIEKSVFVADKVAGVSAYWATSTKVVIQCGDARVFRYRNFWQSREVDNFRHIARIGLSGCAD